MQETIISSIDSLNKFKALNHVCVVYFSTPDCSVCKVLKPKIMNLLESDFPKAVFAYVDIEKSREIAGQFSIFSSPTIIFYLIGAESFRESRNIDLESVKERLKRSYDIMFE